MSDDICFLITILQGDALVKCALKCKRNLLSEDIILYPLEPESRKAIHKLLPWHVRRFGPIVEIEELFEVEIKEDK